MKVFKDKYEKESALKHVTLDGVRLHLKTDERKLWINGFYLLYLNHTATFIMASFIDSCYEVPREQILPETVDKITKRYKVDRKVAEADLQQLIGLVNTFARGEIPHHLVGMKLIGEDKAPFRMDLSVTYECTNCCPHCYLPANKDVSTLTTVQWKTIIDKLWKVGVPQIVFTGGECTLRKDLPELILHAKEFVTGVITNGTLITPELAVKLRKAELDWIQITLESSDAKIHDEMQGKRGCYDATIAGVKNSVAADLQTSINCTLTKKNYQTLNSLIDLAKSIGVNSVTTNALIKSGRCVLTCADEKDRLEERDLAEILKNAAEYAKTKDVQFNWFLPTCYKDLDPRKLGFGQRCCSACSVNMMIEPDGSVIPCQSWTQLKLGNILTDKWEKIWHHPEAEKIRKFGYADDKCRTECEFFETCGGACPLDILNGRRDK